MKTTVILAVVVWTVIGVFAVRSIKGGIEGAKAKRDAQMAMVSR